MKKRKNRKFFDNKTCSICKRTASIYRRIKDRTFYLCYRARCDRVIREKMGFCNSLQIDVEV